MYDSDISYKYRCSRDPEEMTHTFETLGMQGIGEAERMSSTLRNERDARLGGELSESQDMREDQMKRTRITVRWQCVSTLISLGI